MKLRPVHAQRFGGFKSFLSGLVEMLSKVSPDAREAAKVLVEELVQMLLSSTLKAQARQLAAYEERAGKLGLSFSDVLQIAQAIASLVKNRRS